MNFHRLIAEQDASVAELVEIVQRVHARAMNELAWCGPLDDNPSNVMRGTAGRLVIADLFYADGPNLYDTAANAPDELVARIPEHERRFMSEIPLAGSGPWRPGGGKRSGWESPRRTPACMIDIMMLIGQLATARDGQLSSLPPPHSQASSTIVGARGFWNWPVEIQPATTTEQIAIH